ncbi:hypothetical protein [Saccharomonospora piscinae]|uniref:hypothetical protein n=1 Tax=Saccharomonospora piscinae TaxID=687388 RepID=UPI0012DEB5A9|nr:hypothetical protein [Saccharomonospora piscinae]
MNRQGKFLVSTAAVLVAVLSGCGGGSGGGSGDVAGESGPSGSPAPSQSFEQYQLDLAECVRDQGVDMPDPGEDGIELRGGDSDAMRKAMETCREELGAPPAPDGGPPLSEDERYELQLEAAECFREHGIEVADPKPGQASEAVPDAPADVLAECAQADGRP